MRNDMKTEQHIRSAVYVDEVRWQHILRRKQGIESPGLELPDKERQWGTDGNPTERSDSNLRFVNSDTTVSSW